MHNERSLSRRAPGPREAPLHPRVYQHMSMHYRASCVRATAEKFHGNFGIYLTRASSPCTNAPRNHLPRYYREQEIFMTIDLCVEPDCAINFSSYLRSLFFFFFVRAIAKYKSLCSLSHNVPWFAVNCIDA